jgi:acyl carrier protein
LSKLHESLELEDNVELTPDTNLKDLDDYDSLMVLSIISFMHETSACAFRRTPWPVEHPA